MEEFDPAKYLEDEDQSFDPAAYAQPEQQAFSPEQIAAHKQRAMRSFSQGQYPFSSRLLDFLTGASSVPRGALQLAGVPGFEVSPLVDKDSWSYLAGNIADPAAWAVGGAAGKAASVIPRVGPVIKGIIGGGAGGATVGGLSENGDATTGGLFGSVVGGLVPLAGRALTFAGNNFGASGADVRAGNTLRQMAGANLDDVTGAIQRRPTEGLRTAQVLRGESTAELAALDDAMKGRFGQRGLEMQETQAAVRNARLAELSGGSNAEMAATARQLFKERLQGTLDPLRVAGAENANAMTRYAIKLADDVAKLRDAARTSVQRVRDMTAASGRATELSGGRQFQPNLPPGQPRMSGRYDYMDELARKAEAEAVAAAQASLDAGSLARIREFQLESVSERFVPLRLTGVLNKIDEITNSVDFRTNPAVTDTLKKLKGYMAQFVDPQTGTIDAYDLHGIRKNVNHIVDMLYPGANEGQKAAAAMAINKLKPTIDKSLYDAGGGPLIRYLEKYAEGMNQLKRMEFAAKAQNLKPQQLVDLAAGRSPQKVAQVFGEGKTSMKENAGGRIAGAVRLNAAEIARDTRLEKLGKFGDQRAAEIIQDNTFSFGIPNLLNREIATVNAALRRADTFMNREMINRLTNAMFDPKEFMRLVNTLPVEQRSRFIQLLRDPVTAGGVAGAASGNAGLGELPTMGLMGMGSMAYNMLPGTGDKR